jgi:ribosomal protein S18 acetylase RimI-like enzyme
MPVLKIRKMKRADACAVAEMMAALAAYHGDEASARAQDFLARGYGSAKLATVWFATRDRDPAGFAVTYDWMNFVRLYPVRHIDLIFVHDCYRGQGIGSALITKIIADAVASGRGRIAVGAMKDNQRAIDFYRKLGFEPRNDDAAIRYQLVGANLQRAAGGTIDQAAAAALRFV